MRVPTSIRWRRPIFWMTWLRAAECCERTTYALALSRDDEDEGHHARSAARGRAVRSAKAARDGRHLGNRRHRPPRRYRSALRLSTASVIVNLGFEHPDLD